MKKVLIGTLAVVLVLTAMTAGALAAGRGHASRFVDADGDGICDNYTAYCKGTGYGLGYVDADNDGICDNCGSDCRGSGCGSGWGRGSCHGGGRHHGGRHS